MKKNISLLIALTLVCAMLIPLQSFAKDKGPQINISAYADTYIATDNSVLNAESYKCGRLFSCVNSQKDNFGLNAAQISANITFKDLIRSTVTLHIGDVPTSTGWVQGNMNFPLVQEANVGFQLFDNIWLDGGYFLTHIGGESLMPKDNWLSSHSMVTYFQPFYQAGFKFSYETDKFTGALHILNGHGMFEDNNANKTLGWFFGFKPNDKLSISYAGDIGNESPEGTPCQTLMYHNVCVQGDFSKSFAAKAQLDYGSLAESDDNAGDDGTFLGVSAQFRYTVDENWAATGRVAYCMNEDGAFGVFGEAFDNVMGITIGGEYKPTANSFIRLEGRMLSFDEDHKIFMSDDESEASRMELMFNMGIWID